MNFESLLKKMLFRAKVDPDPDLEEGKKKLSEQEQAVDRIVQRAQRVIRAQEYPEL